MKDDPSLSTSRHRLVYRLRQWQLTLDVDFIAPQRDLALDIGRYIPYGMFIVLCTIIGYLVVSQRGYYFDDYVFADMRFTDFPARPLSQLLTIVLMPATIWRTWEPFIWLVMACVTLTNSLLTGYLIYRLIHSRVAFWSIVCTSLFPIWAFEATTVFSTTQVYLLSTLFVLVSLHLFLTALSALSWRWVLYSVVSFIVALLFGEIIFAALLFMPVLAFAAPSIRRRQTVLRTVVTVGSALLISLAIFFTLYQISPMQRRLENGAPILHLPVLLENVNWFFSRTYWLTLDPRWGETVNREAIETGLQAVISSPLVFLSAAAALLLLWRGTQNWKFDEDDLPRARYAVAFALGLSWSVLGLLLPGILAAGQSVETRILYFPTLGVAATIGVTAALVTRFVRWVLVTRVWLLTCGMVVLTLSASMISYETALRNRYQTDQVFLTDYREQLSYLPRNQPITVVTYLTNDTLDEIGENMSRGIYSVFEISYILRINTERYLNRIDMSFITFNRWQIVDIGMDEATEATPPTNVMVGDLSVPVNQLLIMTIFDGHVLPVESANISRQNPEETVTFPLASLLRDQGYRTLKNVAYRSS